MSTPKAQAIPELEHAIEHGCSTPGCSHGHTELFLTQRCHPRAGVDVKYTKGSGVLTITCHHCRQLVATIAVALVS